MKQRQDLGAYVQEYDQLVAEDIGSDREQKGTEKRKKCNVTSFKNKALVHPQKKSDG